MSDGIFHLRSIRPLHTDRLVRSDKTPDGDLKSSHGKWKQMADMRLCCSHMA